MAIRQPITPPPPVPPRLSLLRAAPAAALDDDTLYGGWRFFPELCPGDSGGGIVEVTCLGSTEDPMGEGAVGTTEVVGGTFVVWVAQTCSTVGNLGRDWQGRLRRHLAAEESFWLARQLSLGTFSLPQDALNEDVTVISGAGDPAAIALAELEDRMAGALRGQLGQIHMPFSIFTLLIAAGAIRFDLGNWYSPAGHTVIVDAGYTGAGPGDDAEDVDPDAVWMYGTSTIRVQLGEIQTIPAQAEADGSIPWQAVERDINTVVIRAGRLATYVWDQCVHLGIAVDTTVDPLGGGTAGGGGGDGVLEAVADITHNPIAEGEITPVETFHGVSLVNIGGAPVVLRIHFADDPGGFVFVPVYLGPDQYVYSFAGQRVNDGDPVGGGSLFVEVIDGDIADVQGVIITGVGP